MVGRLLVIAVHLIVDRDAIPPRGRAMAERPVEIARHPVQGDGLIQQLITRCALYFDGEMVPRIVVGIAGDTGGGPMRTLVIPNVPLMAACNAALVPPNEAHAAEKLIHVEFQRLRKA